MRGIINTGTSCYFDVGIDTILILIQKGLISLDHLTNGAFKQHIINIINKVTTNNKDFIETDYLSSVRADVASFSPESKTIIPNGQGNAIAAISWMFKQFGIETSYKIMGGIQDMYSESIQGWILENNKINKQLIQAHVPPKAFCVNEKSVIYTFTVHEFYSGDNKNKQKLHHSTNKVTIPRSVDMGDSKLTLLSCIYHINTEGKSSSGHYALVWCRESCDTYIDHIGNNRIVNANNNNNNNLIISLKKTYINHIIITYIREEKN